METAETIEIKTEHLKQQMLRVESRVEEIEDIALSVEDPQIEQDLRRISADIRKSLRAMETELEEPDDPWLVG